jgi:4'-phosphopantetheinyl transferase
LQLRVSYDVQLGESEAGPAGMTAVLTAQERAQHDRFQFEKRRRDWLTGRFVAKRLVRRMLQDRFGGDFPPSAVQIETASTGAPVPVNAALRGLTPFAPGERLPLELSISHSRGAAFAAAFWQADAPAPDVRIGADLEWIERRPPDLFDDYFTVQERRYCSEGDQHERDARATVVWSGRSRR